MEWADVLHHPRWEWALEEDRPANRSSASGDDQSNAQWKRVERSALNKVLESSNNYSHDPVVPSGVPGARLIRYCDVPGHAVCRHRSKRASELLVHGYLRS